MGCFWRVLTAALMAAQLAVAGAIIGLTASRLNKVDLKWDGLSNLLNPKLSGTCLLGKTPNGTNLCYVAYGFSGVSILATACLALLRCCTCRMCGLAKLFDTVFAAVGTAW